MKKSDAIQKVNGISNLGLDNSNTHFANINTAQFQNKNIWWTEVPSPKFNNGFYLLFCHEDNSLILLKIQSNVLNLDLLYYREPMDCYKLYVCSDRSDNQYMHDLIGNGQVDLSNFILENYE